MNQFNPRSLRARLTLWYCGVLVLIDLILAGASRCALAVKFEGVLKKFYSVLYIALPIVLALGAFGGYWLSGKDRFWRADKVRSRDSGGTGLGLAIAREIARSQGAELTVEGWVGRVDFYSSFGAFWRAVTHRTA